MSMSRVLKYLAAPVLVAARCPFGGEGPVPDGHPGRRARAAAGYAEAVQQLDLDAVKADLKELFTNSQEQWPADFGSYAPLFVRLAWHSSGSYRISDGRGGSEGGHQRFEPEQSWADNTNLDKARALLVPIKIRYGLGLSWGDLIVLAGTTAIESMGGPVLGFCAGRVDAESGADTVALGPSPVQEELYPCAVNGSCTTPLGSTTVGLIYLNPEGPLGVPDPAGSARDIRDSFGRMAMNDSETVALAGGGHAFGKPHGACPAGAGPSPAEDPANPWPGKCGTGKGKDAFTSGFEFQWTSEPTKWDNEYFKLLASREWEKYKGPGGHWQWRPTEVGPGEEKLGMLTSDVSLTVDTAYKQIVEAWAKDTKPFDHAFAHAWYKLVTRDMGPVTRCVGKYVPPAQPFQYPLPAAPAQLADFDKVKVDIQKVLTTSSSVLPADKYDGKDNYGPLFVRLAWACASTFRETDWQGGCNGARLRFSPEKDWPENAALDKTLLLLKPVKDAFGEGLSWADLIVLAGSTAVEQAGAGPIRFCGGRTDAADGVGSEYLAPRASAATDSADVWMNEIGIKGVSVREWVALVGGGHSLGQMHKSRSGYEGSWTQDPTQINHNYFRSLLTEKWEKHSVDGTQNVQYKAVGKELYMLKSDLALRFTPGFAAVAQDFASDNNLFLQEFSAAWTRMMNADRFDGPTGNVCDRHDEKAAELII